MRITTSDMPDVFTKTKRSSVMSAIRGKGNKDTELKAIAIFREFGISGWRRGQNLPGKPDFVFRRERLAIFIDGCFWHACPIHGRKPGSNQEYWLPKLLRNQTRDRTVTKELKKRGWKVLRIWEHALKTPKAVANRCLSALKKTN